MDTSMQLKIFELAERAVIALEKIAEAQKPTAPPLDLSTILGMLPALVGLPQVTPEAPLYDHDPDDAQDLCKCAHAKENHLQGEGPCLLNCPCGEFVLMGDKLEPPKERTTKPETPKAIRRVSHAELVANAPGIRQRCSRCHHLLGDHLLGKCEREDCPCEEFVA